VLCLKNKSVIRRLLLHSENVCRYNSLHVRMEAAKTGTTKVGYGAYACVAGSACSRMCLAINAQLGQVDEIKTCTSHPKNILNP